MTIILFVAAVMLAVMSLVEALIQTLASKNRCKNNTSHGVTPSGARLKELLIRAANALERYTKHPSEYRDPLIQELREAAK
jgi:hypothetical protein